MFRILPCLGLLLGLPVFTTYAQGPVLLRTVPAANSLTGSRTGPVQLTFSQPVGAPGAIQVHANQYRGRRAGTFSGAGTPQISFQAAQPFAPGERVSVTVPASVSSPARVVEFRAAAAPGRAVFSAPVTVGPPPANHPTAVVPGDVDEDGDLDLVACEIGGTAVCLNNGQGAFTSTYYPNLAAPRPQDVELADVNGDGHLDLVSSEYDRAGAYLNLGTGRGTFQPRVSLLALNFYSQLATGDFNADGFTDVVIGEPLVGVVGMDLHFFPGNASGTLVETHTSRSATSWRDLKVADLDEDGDLDLVAVNDIAVGVCRNDGAGRFTDGATATVNSLSGRVVVGDFTGDGHADAVCTSYQTASLSLLPGTGAGGWQALRNVPVLSRTWWVGAGDVDGDGDLDLLPTNDRGITQVLLNNGTGGFAAAAAVLIGWEPFALAEVADLNGDGVLDVFTGHDTDNPSMPHGIDVFFNQPLVPTAAAPARQQAFEVYPNPAQGQLTLRVPPSAGLTTIEIRDALGRLVRTLPAPARTGEGTYQVPLAGLAPGRYALLAYAGTARRLQWVDVQ